MTTTSLTPRTHTPVRRPEEELRTLAAEGARDLGDADARTIAAWAARTFPGSLAVACSMAEAVLPHLVSRYAPGVDVLFLDTGYHFTDTLVTRDIVAQRLPVNVIDIRPGLSVAEQDEAYGPRLYERDPAACCRMRKVEPLARALGGYEAWATGVRREEATTRTNAQVIGWDEKNAMVKVNPLAAWTSDEVMGYSAQHGVPMNLLLSSGYPSIGCEPCTRPVAAGEDQRAGRWAGFAKTECGLHT